ncbi:MAG: hypothetical protein AB4426_21555 [Xenococcaceae cyanobacterium]
MTASWDQQVFSKLSKQVPYLTQRLQSNRWEVRYCLLSNFTRRDAETKQVLEMLVRDEHKGVANQALVRYVNGFVDIDKTLFKAELYVPGRFPITDLPDKEAPSALVDYCLGRREIRRNTFFKYDSMQPILPVLDPAELDNPRMHETLTIIGIMGRPEDAKLLHPFLESPNDYVALGAATAVIRLGDKTTGLEALRGLTIKDPSKHLCYVTEALHVLREMEHPELESMVIGVLSSVDRSKGIQPNWLSEFLILAADVTSKDVWQAPGAAEQA